MEPGWTAPCSATPGRGAGRVGFVDVEVIRSTRRRKTVQARLVGGVLQVSIPARMNADDERRWVHEMVARFERRRLAEPHDLEARAEVLAARYGLERPASIRWVDNQVWRWGSCTPADGTIRVSTRLASFPAWVRDYVIVHELAHLSEAGHGERFWALVNRYPRAERARGFLIAKDLEEAGDDESSAAAPLPYPDTAGSSAAGARPRLPAPPRLPVAPRVAAARAEPPTLF